MLAVRVEPKEASGSIVAAKLGLQADPLVRLDMLAVVVDILLQFVP